MELSKSKYSQLRMCNFCLRNSKAENVFDFDASCCFLKVSTLSNFSLMELVDCNSVWKKNGGMCGFKFLLLRTVLFIFYSFKLLLL